MPKVSVIIPTFNRANYIAGSINSVLNQTFSDYEIIVVDDGSTDGTERVIREQFNDKVIYLSKPNGGQGSARNMGVGIAKGEYIAFLDSDDLWFPEKLEVQTCFMDAHPEVGLTSSWAVEFRESESGEIEDLGLLRSQRSPTLRNMLRGNCVLLLTAMARKKCLESLEGFDEDRSMMGLEDYEMWIRFVIKHKIAHIPRALARYRTHEENFFYGKSSWENAQAYFAVINRIDEKLPGLITDIFGSKKKFYAERYQHFGDMIPFCGDMNEKIKFYRESIKLDKTGFKAALKILCCCLAALKQVIIKSNVIDES